MLRLIIGVWSMPTGEGGELLKHGFDDGHVLEKNKVRHCYRK